MYIFMFLIILIFVCLLSIEIFSWLFCIDRHVLWLIKNENEKLLSNSPIKFRISCAFSLLFSLFCWLLFCHDLTAITFTYLQNDNINLRTFLLETCIIMCIQLTFIHMWSLVARHLCLPVILWPIFSKWKYNILRKYEINQPLSEYCYQFKKWNDAYNTIGQHQSLLLNFLDVIPGLIWTKDLEGNFIYANNSFKKLIGLTDFELYGNTDSQLVELLKKRNCILSIEMKKNIDYDELVIKNRKIINFLRKGYLDDKLIVLDILKTPIYENSKGKQKIIGTISLGVDVTMDWQEHEQILNAWQLANTELAFKLFKKHINKYEKFRQEE